MLAKMYSRVTTNTLGFEASSWEKPAGQGFQSLLNLVALQDRLSDMRFHQEVVNMLGMKTGRARSLFGQD